MLKNMKEMIKLKRRSYIDIKAQTHCQYYP